MPLFLSDEEFDRCAQDAAVVAEKADAFIMDLQRHLDTVKAQADASAITTEQTCALFEEKYISLSSDFSKLESENAHLSASLEQRISDLADTQSQNHQLHLQTIAKDGEIGRLTLEASEHSKSKRQLLELLEQKDAEIGEKNALIKSYLDKIVNSTDSAALKEARMQDIEAELAHLRATCARLSQEKELVERHNAWLNEELTAKVNSVIELRRSHTEFEVDMTAKLADIEKQFNESSNNLKWYKDRVRELELKLTSAHEELCSSKDAAAAIEERFSAELSTVTKLVELYKESADEWSKKAGELEGVIKALETHLNQVENDYKEKLEKETMTTKDLEKVVAGLKVKLQKYEIEIENARKTNELSLVPLSGFQSDPNSAERWMGSFEIDGKNEDSHMLVPKVPSGVSGTALAASLLRDGWSLAKMYEKYQEAVDAFRHEQLGRKQSQMILERILFEIQEKAEVILDERAAHERMVEAYDLMNRNLQQSRSENANFENTIRQLKVDLKKRERDYNVAKKEIMDLQKQVTVLLKECRDMQLRYEAAGQIYSDNHLTSVADIDDENDIEKVISERLLTFKDINGLVEQNVLLRSVVRDLSNQIDQRDTELRESHEAELQKCRDEAEAKAGAVAKRIEEQDCTMQSLRRSVAMYSRLCEEQLKTHTSYPESAERTPDDGRKDRVVLFEGSQEASRKANEQATERVRNLEEDLAKCRNEVISMRLERDRLAMEANFARERLDSFMKEFDHQREEINGVQARNVEFSQLIVDYQRRLRENADSLNTSEERSRKLSMEVSIVKQEKDILINSEKRAFEEVRTLSERVHRLQASLDTIQSAQEVQEDARAMEKKKHEEYVKHIEREWAEAKKELQEERDHVRTLTLDRDQTLKNAMEKVEEVRKELADALHAVAAAEARATLSEARCSELEAKLKLSEEENDRQNGANSMSSTNEVIMNLQKAKLEIEKLKEEAQANKNDMIQYKEIALVNEAALKQIESAHETSKAKSDKLKKSLEAEIHLLRGRVLEAENDVVSKTVEVASIVAEKDEALSSTLTEINRLKEENSMKMSKMVEMEIQLTTLKEDLDREHKRWRSAQNNYERQVILQSETIQELKNISQALASLEGEASELRTLADARKNENDVLKATWDKEKSVLQESKDKAERKYKEINEQNQVLHDRLEALHIKLAETARNSAGDSSGSISSDPKQDDDLQKVIGYLRRSKEIAETEISLLKQEKLRLQSQLESALKASETAQSLLNAERANSRATPFTDEEFKTLKLQLREMNLLRESNVQLREENKHNFEECQKYREIVQRAKMETENFVGLLREKEIELDGYRKEIKPKSTEMQHLEREISELQEKSKNISVEDYDRIKDDFQQTQINLKQKEAEVDEVRKLLSVKQENISCLEHDLANCQLELTELQKKMNDILQTEASMKMEFEKQNKSVTFFKKKVETLTKEKDELIKEKQVISKQIEDLKFSKKLADEALSEQAMKEKAREKDTRIHMLERTLEREREDLRREKSKRQKTEKTVEDLMKKVTEEKQQLLEKLESNKHHADGQGQIGGTSFPLSSDTRLEEQAALYLLATDTFEEAAHSALNDGLGSQPIPAETSLMDSSPAGQQVTATSGGPTSSQVKMEEKEKERRMNVPKPSIEGRKTGRRLVRPRLERPHEPASGNETPEARLGTAPLDQDPRGELSLPSLHLARKRPASAASSELQEQPVGHQEAVSDTAPMLKKSKGSESPQEGVEEQPSHSFENVEKPFDEMGDDAGDPANAFNQDAVDVAKDEEADTAKDPMEEPRHPPLEAVGLSETLNEENYTVEELKESPRNTEEMIDEGLKFEVVLDAHQSTLEAEHDREEGELVSDGIEQQPEGGDISITMMDLEPGEIHSEPVAGATASNIDGAVDTGDAAEIASQEGLDEDKNDGEEIMEEVADGSDKSNDNNGQGVGDSQQSPTPTFGAGEGSSSLLADSAASKQFSPSISLESEEGKQPGATRSTGTINISERAKQRAELRRARVVSPPLTRGRGRAAGNQKDGGRGGRFRRGGRGARGPSSGEQNH